MATLSVTKSHDYRADDLSDITLIDFDNGFLTTATATFDESQFDGAQIAFDAEIRGSIGFNGLVIVGQFLATEDFIITSWGRGDSITLQGTAGNDSLVGSGFNETLNGGRGDDELLNLPGAGGVTAGSDKFNGGAGNDRIEGEFDARADKFNGGAGTDTLVYRSTGYFQNPDGIYDLTLDISDGGGGRDIGNGSTVAGIEIVQLVFQTSGVVDFTGGKGNDEVLANDHWDTLRGMAGDDYLAGADGQDELLGGEGKDTLVGGRHADALDGGAGGDIFFYERIDDSNASGFDLISGFVPGEDVIDLHAIDANTKTKANDAFTFIGSDSFSGVAGELRATRASFVLGNTTIRADTDGDSDTDLLIRLTFRPLVTEGDLVL